MSTAAVISNHVELGNNITIGVNSVVNKTIDRDNVLLVGTPATVKKDSEPWYVRDSETFRKRVERVKKLKIEMGV